jgi:ATP-binding cassette subfamily B protein/subfamily B ATP-binding cassette protein MsbA
MKEFWKILKQYAAPYKSSIVGSIVFNILSAVFNIFSFTIIIPILQILFKIDTTVYESIPWESSDMSFREIFMNNMYFHITEIIAARGASTALLLLGLFFGAITLLNTSCYFASSAIMIPLSTGIVRDIRVQVYNKVVSLPMSFF